MNLRHFKNISIIAVLVLFGVVRGISAQASIPRYIPTLSPSSFSESPSLKLTKTNYEAGENVSFDYLGKPTPLNIEVKNTSGIAIPFQAILKQKNNKVLEIELSKRIVPGKYRISVKHADKTLINADIYLGMYLFNVAQNEYKNNEVIVAQLLHFSDDGQILCDPISASILAPEKESTPESALALHAPCSQSSPSYFESIVQPTIAGNYIYKLPFLTSLSSDEYTQNINVGEIPPLQVKRQGPILVNSDSDSDYEVKFTIKAASTDLVGTVEELVPANLILTGNDGLNGPNSLTVDTDSLKLRYPFNGDYPSTLEFGEVPDENHLLEAYHAFGVKAHDGLDFALNENTPILAVDDGHIIEAPLEVAAYGETVSVQHSWGRTFYGHLSQKKAHIGDFVKKGDVIGLSGSTGLATGPHLHFGIDLNSMNKENGYLGKIDPQPYLATRHNFMTSQKKLSWDINLKAGEERILTYHARFPEDGYTIYQLGALKLKNAQGDAIYEEQRPWNVVKVD